MSTISSSYSTPPSNANNKHHTNHSMINASNMYNIIDEYTLNKPPRLTRIKRIVPKKHLFNLNDCNFYKEIKESLNSTYKNKEVGIISNKNILINETYNNSMFIGNFPSSQTNTIRIDNIDGNVENPEVKCINKK